MTQNEKELLLKDITARLYYGVKASTKIGGNIKISFIGEDTIMGEDGDSYDISFITPYLFPLSSMTERQKDEIRNRFCYEWEPDEDISDLWKHELEFGYALEFIQWCYENHLDIGGLIPRGLAIDATNKKIY